MLFWTKRSHDNFSEIWPRVFHDEREENRKKPVFHLVRYQTPGRRSTKDKGIFQKLDIQRNGKTTVNSGRSFLEGRFRRLRKKDGDVSGKKIEFHPWSWPDSQRSSVLCLCSLCSPNFFRPRLERSQAIPVSPQASQEWWLLDKNALPHWSLAALQAITMVTETKQAWYVDEAGAQKGSTKFSAYPKSSKWPQHGSPMSSMTWSV